MLVKVLKNIAVLLIVANVVHVLEVDDIEDDVRSFIENDLSKERGVNYLYDNITKLDEQSVIVAIYEINADNSTDRKICNAIMDIVRNVSSSETIGFEVKTVLCKEKISDYIEIPFYKEELPMRVIYTEETNCPNCPSEIDINSEGAQKLWKIILDDIKDKANFTIGENNLIKMQRQVIYIGGYRYFLYYEVYELNDDGSRGRHRLCRSMVFRQRSGTQIEDNECYLILNDWSEEQLKYYNSIP